MKLSKITHYSEHELKMFQPLTVHARTYVPRVAGDIARVAKVIFSNIIALRALHDAHLSIHHAYMNTVQANNNFATGGHFILL